MKKLIFILFMTFFCVNSYSQNYNFKKVFAQVSGAPPTTLKLQGSVTISDTLISLTQNGVKSDMIVFKISPNQYKSKISEDNEMRFTLTPDKDNFLLVMELKDKFSGNYSSIMYYLTTQK